ncbi:MAG: protease [Candidatus Ozemobacter sibiricus]|uniref:Protease n=1 Tax=Candidatus Ozemobacter sibiricus TaxID=2268124 RepID=A0A367ZKV7_9BACT|nr:MAG: protease [Candidatus Ozemobacter sibiricus]
MPRSLLGKIVFFLASSFATTLFLPSGAVEAVDLAFDRTVLEKAVVEHVLDNGLRILILPRPEVPVVSLVTWADVGGADDPKGLTGMAHMFEHMAFKGTSTIGSRDIVRERELMAREDAIFAAIQAERAKGPRADPAVLASLTADLERASAEAYQLVEPSAFANLLQREGGTGLNAFTSRDQTAYIVSLPANKIELWMAMESERFLDPVLREMYKEREVVAEERRMTVENRPSGKLFEDFIATAFKAHPYGQPLIGHMSDIQNYSRAAAMEVFQRAYGPGNLILSIVGDVDPARVIALAKKYWGRLPARPVPGRLTTVEPEQLGERRVIIEDRAQPTLLIGWHVPAGTHPDTPAIEALTDILGQGRTSRLHRRLVRDLKAAVSVSAFTGFPGTKYPSLAVVYAMPAPGSTNASCEAVIHEEIARLQNEPLTNEDLEKVKARAMAGFLRGLRSNMGLAQQLASYQQLWGDWRELFRELDRINAVTPADVQRVARTYFTARNRTVAMLETIATPAASSPARLVATPDAAGATAGAPTAPSTPSAMASPTGTGPAAAAATPAAASAPASAIPEVQPSTAPTTTAAGSQPSPATTAIASEPTQEKQP